MRGEWHWSVMPSKLCSRAAHDSHSFQAISLGIEGETKSLAITREVNIVYLPKDLLNPKAFQYNAGRGSLSVVVESARKPEVFYRNSGHEISIILLSHSTPYSRKLICSESILRMGVQVRCGVDCRAG